MNDMIKKLQSHICWIVVLIGVLTACNGINVVSSQIPSELQTTNVTILSTESPTPTKTQQPTKTPSSTVTTSPTKKPSTSITTSPTKTISPTEAPSPIVTVSPTESLVVVTGSTLTRVKDGMVMVNVPEGVFTMGNDNGAFNEQPQHMVYLEDYWIDQTEVPNAMFTLFVEAIGYRTNGEKRGSAWVFDGASWNDVAGADWQHPQGPTTNLNGLENHPVVNVSWKDAKAYCEWVGAHLPSEAEWEKAARGTDGRTYPWGEQEPGGNLLNFGDMNLYPNQPNNNNDGYIFTAPIGSYPLGASPYGVLDLLGNVWEWVNDWYQETYYTDAPTDNPTGPSFGEGRVLRGGSWNHDAQEMRSSFRMGNNPYDAIDNFGFRCSLSLP